MPQAPLAAKEGKEAPRRQVRNRSARRHRYTPNPKGSNPVSRDLAADACGKLTAHQPRERGVPRLEGPFRHQRPTSRSFKTATRQRSSRRVA